MSTTTNESTAPKHFDRIPAAPRPLSTMTRLSLLFSGGWTFEVGMGLGFAGLLPAVVAPLIMREFAKRDVPDQIDFLSTAFFTCFCGMGIFIFCLLGAGLVSYAVFWRGVKHLRLIERGEIAGASFQRQEGTDIKLGNQPLVKLVFAFQTPDGQSHETWLYTTNPTAVWSGARDKLVFYDPADPDTNVLWDKLTVTQREMIFFNPKQQTFHGRPGFVVMAMVFILAIPVELYLFGSQLVSFAARLF